MKNKSTQLRLPKGLVPSGKSYSQYELLGKRTGLALQSIMVIFEHLAKLASSSYPSAAIARRYGSIDASSEVTLLEKIPTVTFDPEITFRHLACSGTTLFSVPVSKADRTFAMFHSSMAVCVF
jgi:hypothetical protein